MLTKAELQQRRGHIGGSDVAAILGISPWKSAYDCWAEKTGKLEARSGDSDAADAGTRFEAAVLDKAEETLGPLTRKVYVEAKGLGFPLAVNLDAMLTKGGEPVEAKTSGLFGPLSSDWGEPGTEEIPEYYIVQCQAELVAAEKALCYVPAFLGGKGFVTDPPYLINRNADLIQVMLDQLGQFWNKYVKTDTRPDNSSPSIEVAKRIRRVPKSSVLVDPEKVRLWAEARAARLAAKKTEEFAYAAVLGELGTAEGGLGGASGSVTYYEQSKTVLDEAKLASNFPDAFAACQKKTFYRVLRFQKPK